MRRYREKVPAIDLRGLEGKAQWRAFWYAHYQLMEYPGDLVILLTPKERDVSYQGPGRRRFGSLDW